MKHEYIDKMNIYVNANSVQRVQLNLKTMGHQQIHSEISSQFHLSKCHFHTDQNTHDKNKSIPNQNTNFDCGKKMFVCKRFGFLSHRIWPSKNISRYLSDTNSTQSESAKLLIALNNLTEWEPKYRLNIYFCKVRS